MIIRNGEERYGKAILVSGKVVYGVLDKEIVFEFIISSVDI